MMNKCHRVSHGGLFFMLAVMLLWGPVSSSAQEVTPTHVFARVQDLNDDLGLIRQEIGMEEPGPSLFLVQGAAPSEVLYQAITLCDKSSQLRFEWTRSLGRCPPSPLGVINPDDVIEYVGKALEHLEVVKEHFEIDFTASQRVIDMGKTPSDVFMDIVAANRQLNILLRKRYLPDDVFRQVTLALYYGAELLGRFPDIKQRIPVAPPLVRLKRPEDVFQRLLNCFALLRKVSEISGQEALEITIVPQELSRMRPSDVYDVAALIVSKLAWLDWLSGGRMTLRSYQPPPKIPSQVFQRSGILLEQLQILLRSVEKDPAWLQRES